jgi:hypothetical protein
VISPGALAPDNGQPEHAGSPGNRPDQDPAVTRMTVDNPAGRSEPATTSSALQDSRPPQREKSEHCGVDRLGRLRHHGVSTPWQSPRTEEARALLREVLRGRGLSAMPSSEPRGWDLRAVARVFGESS